MVKNIKSINRVGMFLLFWGFIIATLKYICYFLIESAGNIPDKDITAILDGVIGTMIGFGVVFILIAMYNTHKVVLEMMEETEEELEEEERV